MFWERDAFGISIIHSWHLLCDMSHNSPLGSTLYEHLPEAVIVPTETHTPADTPSEAALQSNQDDGIAERPQTIDPGFDIPDLK